MGRARDERERFWEKVNKNGPVPTCRPDLGPCWLWTGRLSEKGYGMFRRPSGWVKAHRVSYEQVHGRIPPGREPDHLCRVRPCVNEAHLEAVTHHENTLRGREATKTHCVRGHLYKADTYVTKDGHRECRVCHRENTNRQRATKGRRQTSACLLNHHQAVKTHCPAGHPYDAANTYRIRGERRCRICMNEATKRWQHKRNEVSLG